MKKQLLTLALAGSFVMSGISTVNAECNLPKEPCKKQPRAERAQKPTPEEMRANMEKRVEEFNKALGLSDEQVKKAKEIRTGGHNKMKPLMEKKKAKMDEIKAVMDNDDIKIKEQDKKIELLRADLKEIDQEIRQLRQDNEKEFKSILTDEQKAKYQQIKEEGRRHFKQYHSPQGPEAFGNRGGHGPKGPHHGGPGFGPKPAPDATVQPVVKQKTSK